ncbi:hypothetical protein AC1031_002119 [Aphanomyces cochlioides]|nr:hypothetical protein AC1031_002119 [Aphanomyces cochlioides]
MHRDAITTIAEHEEWGLQAEDADADLPATLAAIRACKAVSVAAIVKSLKAAQEVYLAFVMDTTGSMAGHMDAVKSQVREIAAAFQREGLTLHVAFVGYKDHCDGPHHFQILPFSTDVLRFERFVQAIPAEGGGDTPEDVLGALMACATQLTWTTDCTNVLFHIGDAPPHGTQFWEGDDSLPHGHPDDPSLQDLFGKLEEQNVRYYFGKLNELTDKMIGMFQSVAKHDVTVFQVLDPIKIHSSVVAASKQTVLTNRDKAILRRVKPSYAFVLDEPEWSVIEPSVGQIVRYAMHPNAAVDAILNDPMNLKARQRQVRIAPHPFARGCERAAFYAQESPAEEKLGWLSLRKTKKKDGPWLKMVAKRFLVAHSATDEARYMKAMEGQAIAAALASTFSNAVDSSLSLHYVDTSVVQLSSTEFVALEQFLDNFERFTDNRSYVTPSVGSDKWVQLAVAFSHWTWTVTKGYLMIADLQGQRLDAGLLLTDPAIHCSDCERFNSGTNFGQSGMDLFFKTHICNDLCSSLGLSMH